MLIFLYHVPKTYVYVKKSYLIFKTYFKCLLISSKKNFLCIYSHSDTVIILKKLQWRIYVMSLRMEPLLTYIYVIGPQMVKNALKIPWRSTTKVCTKSPPTTALMKMYWNLMYWAYLELTIRYFAITISNFSIMWISSYFWLLQRKIFFTDPCRSRLLLNGPYSIQAMMYLYHNQFEHPDNISITHFWIDNNHGKMVNARNFWNFYE